MHLSILESKVTQAGAHKMIEQHAGQTAKPGTEKPKV